MFGKLLFGAGLLLGLASVAIAGNKVVVVPMAGDVKTLTKTVTLQLPAGAFRSTVFGSSDSKISYSNGERLEFLTGSGDAVAISAPVTLPDEAIVKSLSCYIQDKDASMNFGFGSSAALYRIPVGSEIDESMADVDLLTNSGTATTIQSLSSTTISHPVISTGGYLYYIYILLQLTDNAGGFVVTPLTAGADVFFWGCTLVYEEQVLSL